jgi:osmotically-inducible protein OsmY
MKKFALSLGLILSSAILIAACESATVTDTAGGKLTNSELETKIKNRLNTDEQVKAADLSVSADASENTGTLSGSVASEAIRMRAVSLAKGANTGIVITDKISVKPVELTRAEYTEDMAKEARVKAKSSGDTLGDSLDDAWIHTKIVAKLIGNTTTPERKINVDVVNNVVTLRGVVNTAEQKAEAERVAKDTEGVTKVNNKLTVNRAA